jgi:uncharacterized membrane protein
MVKKKKSRIKNKVTFIAGILLMLFGIVPLGKGLWSSIGIFLLGLLCFYDSLGKYI